MNLVFEPQSLDWHLASDSYSFTVISNLMVGLTRYGDDMDVVPGCATHWDINDESTEFTFYLDPQAKWTDGMPVKAQHFIDAFNRIQGPKIAAPYADLLSIIDLEETRAINDGVLFIKLKRPAAYFLGLTPYGLALPIRKDLIEKYGDKWTEPEHFLSNGPYELKSWQHEYKIVMEANPDFHLDKAKVRYLKYFMVPEQASAYTLFKNKQFDWIDQGSIPSSEMRKLSALQLKASKGDAKAQSELDKLDFVIDKKPILRGHYTGFTVTKEPFDDKRVRQAFSYALDRSVFPEILGKGEIPSASWIPSGLSDYYDSERGLDFKPELARKLIAEAGYPSGKGFPTVEFLFPSTEESKLLAETMQSLWKKELGITVKLVAMEWKVYLDTLYRDPPPIFRSGWGADYPDPDTFMQIFQSTNAINHGKWSNAEYDQLTMKAAAIKDVVTRKALYKRAEEILTKEEMAIASLFIKSQIILRRKNIKGLSVNPMDVVFLDRVVKE